MAHYTPLCSADTPTEAEKAQTLLTKASRDAALVNAGIISPEEARGALIADKESGYGDISAEAPEMGDLAQLQGLLGPEGGQEPQPGQDKATDSATNDFDPNQKRDKSGQWTAEGGSETSSTENGKKHFQNPKKAILRFEREDESGDHNVLSIRRFIAPIIVNNKPAYAKLTVKETHTNNENHKNIYTVELHSLEQVERGNAALDSLV